MTKAKTVENLSARRRRSGNFVFSALFFLFCLFLVFNLNSQTSFTSGAKLFAQPAFWPYLAVITMTIFSGLHLISSLRSPEDNHVWAEIKFWLRSLEFAGWFMGYVALAPRCGYLPSTLVFTVLLSFRLGYRNVKTLSIAALFGAGVVLIFKSFLQVKVPGGQLYEYLPTALRAFMLTYF